jgi:deoxycytidylate deaminase
MAADLIELSDPGWQRHDFYMRLAMVVESGAKCLGSHVGAVIVRDNRVLGSGYNGTPAGYPNCTESETGRAWPASCTTSACASTRSRTRC